MTRYLCIVPLFSFDLIVLMDEQDIALVAGDQSGLYAASLPLTNNIPWRPAARQAEGLIRR